MRELKKAIWPHKVTLNSDLRHVIVPVECWLDEQFGKFKDRWNVVYQYNRTDFYFKSGRDATMFALRWL